GDWQRLGPPQPNMYFCIDLPQLRVVCIDTGIEGRLDYEQGQWLRKVSADPRPKLLISGKPIYYDAGVSPRRILPSGGRGGQGETLLEIIQDVSFNYRAVLSGDVHNYQRYPVRQADGRDIQFVVCGGGGAFMTATHKIPAVDLPGVSEQQFVCYPQRGDSLRAYSIVYQWLRTGQGRRRNMRSKLRRRKVAGIPADEAAVIVAQRHGLPMAPELRDVVVSERSRQLAQRVFGIDRRSGPWEVSELLDWDCPPLFKSFLRLSVGDGGVDVECFAVNGLPSDSDPSLIDSVRIDF
ncbi:MAG: hypothetical protein JHC87_01590, partial [Thermoleophilaceae bacterium]|nr:hypothetical protein [Thermoleophilaceae bacterium]